MNILRLDQQTALPLKNSAYHAPNALKSGQHLFGKHSSGCGDLSSKRKELVKEKIRAKRA